jgi:KDO2-lipid IV(A) lauroyltransferase
VKALLAARDLALTALVLALAFPLWILPRSLAVALGGLYGSIACAFWPRARRIGMINLRRAYGKEMTGAKARKLVAEVVRNLGRSVAEGIQFAKRFKHGDPAWQDLYDAEDPALEARLLADPRPKVFVTGHLGSWEVAVMMAAHRVARGSVIARRVDNPFLDAVVRRVRTRNPEQWIEKQGAVSAALARLRKGESIALLQDENGGYRGLFVDYFGRPASTRKTAALLAVMTGAPLVVGAAVRRRGGDKLLFRLAVLETPSGRRATPADVRDLTGRLVSIYEAWVRESTEQWRWIHTRWKTRPDGSEETYTRADVVAEFGEAV